VPSAGGAGRRGGRTPPRPWRSFEWQRPPGDKRNVHVGRIHKIKFWDKPRSIENFMKHLAMLVDRKEINGQISLADLVAGSMEPMEHPKLAEPQRAPRASKDQPANLSRQPSSLGGL
jgi:hypothetical protein